MNTPFRSSGPKVALITGGARNIGLQIARELTSQGVVVAIAGICRDLATIPYRLSYTDNLHRAVEELKQMGIDAVGLECDGRSEHHVKSIVAEVIRRFGRVDILVNNAGVISLCPIQDLTEEAWTAGTFDIFTIYIGDRLGFYWSLGEDGPATSGELAARAGAYERYEREWLEQQTVAGILKVEDETTAAARRYRLPAGHKEVLVDRDSLNCLAPLVQIEGFVSLKVLNSPLPAKKGRCNPGPRWRRCSGESRLSATAPRALRNSPRTPGP